MQLPNDIHQTIAGQVQHMMPAHLEAGEDVVMGIVDEATVRVLVKPTERMIDIRYDAAPDTYTVTRYDVLPGKVLRPDGEPVSDIYCDQLGEMCFGNEAKQWTQPFGYILGDDGVTRF